MMRALEPETYDLLYEMVEELLPEPPEHPYGGCRQRIPDKICFRGLFLRFITGQAWETIEALMDHQVSDTTLRTRRTEWVNAGVFEELMARSSDRYHELVGLNLDDVTLDGSSQLAPGGGAGTSSYPSSKGRKGYKWHCGVDAVGMGLAFMIDHGARNDYKLLQPTLDLIFDQHTRIGTLHLDRGYGYPKLAEKLDGYPITAVDVIPRKKPGEGRVVLAGIGNRWIVERTNAWLTNFGQLRRNWDRTTRHRHAAVALGFAILFTYRLIDHKRRNTHPPESIR